MQKKSTWTVKRMGFKNLRSPYRYRRPKRVTTANDVGLKNQRVIVEKSIKGMLAQDKLGAELFSVILRYMLVQPQSRATKTTAINLNGILSK